jgi:hypothetical protein
MTDSPPADVLVCAPRDWAHSRLECVVSDPEATFEWQTDALASETGCGAALWVADGEEIYARADIRGVEADGIVFAPLEPAAVVPPRDPPEDGFVYIQTVWRPDVEASTEGAT